MAPARDRVWEHSTDDFEIVCDLEDVGFSDLVNDNPRIQRAIEFGTADVVRLVVEVGPKGGLVYGMVQVDAIENVEHRGPTDVFQLDHSFVQEAAVFALAKAIHFLEDGGNFLAGKVRNFRDDFRKATMS